MCQSYKVFINNFFILFTKCNNQSINNVDISTKNQKVFDSHLSLMQYLIDNQYIIQDNIVCFSKDPQIEMVKFKNHFKVIVAAGGVVQNSRNQILMIYKNNIWDLPKGKVDFKENFQTAAIREVKEETNVKCMINNHNTYLTYHLYKDLSDSQLILKETKWFSMKTSKNYMLKPQLEEGILDIKWWSFKDFNKIHTYQAVKILCQFFNRINN